MYEFNASTSRYIIILIIQILEFQTYNCRRYFHCGKFCGYSMIWGRYQIL